MENTEQNERQEVEKRTFIGAHVRQPLARAVKLAAINDGLTMQKWVEEVLSRELESRSIQQQ